MILLTAFSQFYVTSQLADLRAQMGSVESTPATVRSALHSTTSIAGPYALESAVLLLCIAAMYLTVRAS